MDRIFQGLIQLVVYVWRLGWTGLTALGSGQWLRVEAIVTADPVRIEGVGGIVVEFPYSYRFEGELYSGLHEEPCLFSESEFMERFAKGIRFVVRVKPSAPEISLVRQRDQAAGVLKEFDRIDERNRRDVASS